MTLAAAGILAMTLSFVAFIDAAVWYVAPWLAQRGRADALIPLLWVHAFRHVALQILSAQKSGFAISDVPSRSYPLWGSCGHGARQLLSRRRNRSTERG